VEDSDQGGRRANYREATMMKHFLKPFSLLLISITCISLAGMPAAAHELGDKGSSFGRGASDAIVPFVVLGELSVFLKGKKGHKEAITGGEALIANELATRLLKTTVRERRPNGDSRTSFPSGHASAAFAMATVIAKYQPKLKWPAYAAAATIGWSRVDVNAHYWHDVAAGALLGHYIAGRFVSGHLGFTPRGLGLSWKW
jgi:membrane-associated phospholipid phosphatase